MSHVRRWRCKSCREIFPGTEVLIAKHPFISSGSISGCPRCKAGFDSTAELICDVPGCTEEASCGWPIPGSYRNTCHKHWEGK